MCRAYRVCSPRQLVPKSTSGALPRLHGSGALELGTVLPSSPRPTYKHDFIHTQLYIFRNMLGIADTISTAMAYCTFHAHGLGYHEGRETHPSPALQKKCYFVEARRLKLNLGGGPCRHLPNYLNKWFDVRPARALDIFHNSRNGAIDLRSYSHLCKHNSMAAMTKTTRRRLQ